MEAREDQIAEKQISKLCRKAAAQGAVLPLSEKDHIAVFGRCQIEYYRSGTGSGGAVNVPYTTNLIEGLRRNQITVNEELVDCYIQNIKHKTDAELRSLRDCGINGLDIGVESGLDEALKYMNKGHTAEEAREQLLRLTKAGIDYSFNAILGCGGADLWKENAEATADLVNAVQPHLLFIGTLHAQPECRLYGDMRNGAFKECTCSQLLDEQERLISRLDELYILSMHI